MFLKTADADLFITASGSGARTFVAHGGWVGSGELWLQPFEQLSKAWRCVTYDHRGTGATVHRGGAITAQHLEDDLFRVLDALRIDKCVLAGESMGCMTALGAILRRPERFSGLVLVSPRHPGGRSEGAARLIAGCQADFAATMHAFVSACTPEEGCEAERSWGRQIVMRSNAAHAIDLMRCMDDVDLVPRLGEIKVPTLLIHGTRDAITPLGNSEFLAGAIADCKLVRLEGAGHVPTVTRAGEVAGAIQQFFAAR